MLQIDWVQLGLLHRTLTGEKVNELLALLPSVKTDSVGLNLRNDFPKSRKDVVARSFPSEALVADDAAPKIPRRKRAEVSRAAQLTAADNAQPVIKVAGSLGEGYGAMRRAGGP